MQNINFVAVLLAAASSFLLGGLWYSNALFGRVWNRLAQNNQQKRHPVRAFGVSFVFACIAATAFAWWVGPWPQLDTAVLHGLLIGLCFITTSFGINYQFANRPFALTLIDGGYHITQFVLFGIVFGLWH